MALPNITAIGNLIEDPELTYTSNSIAVAKVRIACNERKQDGAGQWIDGDATYITGSVWRQTAEVITAELKKGDPVIVSGKLKQRSWTDEKTGTNRSVYEIAIDTIGRDMRKSPKMKNNDSLTDPWQSSGF
jgi:single-strand DNA-binding protein